MTKPAKNCQTMVDVRLGVDEIDRKLVALLAERQTYMSAAARIKSDRDKVYDKERIEDIVTKVTTGAHANGLCPYIAENVWRELIKQSIAFEFKQWDHMRQ